ncbi:hypothetical protein ABZS39_27830 [Micromonospora luteifusca]
MEGLLSNTGRKTCWSLAERAGHADPQVMQRLLPTAVWDPDAVRDDVRDWLVEQLGHPRRGASHRRDGHRHVDRGHRVGGLPDPDAGGAGRSGPFDDRRRPGHLDGDRVAVVKDARYGTGATAPRVRATGAGRARSPP